jgi:large subunit ribosomal protein L13|tara:strand:- start:3182 stop:3667 length:486 start_codon:yes stop_codon:yes gene_type:complete
LDDQQTLVYDASEKILGRLASHIASQMLSARKGGSQQMVIILNAEKAIVSGPKKRVFGKYRAKYELNHARKGPFFPRMPDQIFKRTVRGMLPYQKNSSGRNSLRDLRVMIGTPSNLRGDELPDGHQWGDTSKIERPLPLKFVSLGEISEALGVDSTRWGAE